MIYVGTWRATFSPFVILTTEATLDDILLFLKLLK